MSWINTLRQLSGKDAYSQNGEGLCLEYIFSQIGSGSRRFIDIGCGDGFYLSNTRHLLNLGWSGILLDKLNGHNITVDNILSHVSLENFDLCSIDIDGNDYWVLEKLLQLRKPSVIVAEFNGAFTDTRTIQYDPNFVWQGDDYFGFSFLAGLKLAHENGYIAITNNSMNIYLVREDMLGSFQVPELIYEPKAFFRKSERTDWIIY